MVESDSVPALVAAIQRIMDNPQLDEHLAQNARRDSVQYSWDERARRILDHAL
jgi:glycosyltransferase involved in cell wall biosynthesis